MVGMVSAGTNLYFSVNGNLVEVGETQEVSLSYDSKAWEDTSFGRVYEGTIEIDGASVDMLAMTEMLEARRRWEDHIKGQARAALRIALRKKGVAQARQFGMTGMIMP